MCWLHATRTCAMIIPLPRASETSLSSPCPESCFVYLAENNRDVVHFTELDWFICHYDFLALGIFS